MCKISIIAIFCLVFSFLSPLTAFFLGGSPSLEPAGTERSQFSAHFKTSEFACNHCGQGSADPKLVKALENFRFFIGGLPIIITSGYRCEVHNSAVAGARRSQHLLGRAADIKVKGISAAELAGAAKRFGDFKFIKEYSTWIHVDMRK